MPSEHIHHHSPTQTRKDRPPIPSNLFPKVAPPIAKQPIPTASSLNLPRTLGLHQELGEGKAHASKHIYDNLLGHRVMNRTGEDDVTTEQASEEGVVVTLFPGRRRVTEEEHGGFVNQREETEVPGMLAGGFEDKPAFGSQPMRCQLWFLGASSWVSAAAPGNSRA